MPPNTSPSIEFVGFKDDEKTDTVNFWQFRTREIVEFSSNRTEDKEDVFDQFTLARTGADVLGMKFPLNARLKDAFGFIRKLTDDWDSYGATKPSEKTIDSAITLCAKFPEDYQPEVQPEANGSIGLYWDYKSVFGILVGEKKSEWFVEVDEKRTEGVEAQPEDVASAFFAYFLDNGLP